MTEPTLSPEIVERIRHMLLIEHPEMEGAACRVSSRRYTSQPAIAERLGLPAVEMPEQRLYTVTLRKEVAAEDGVLIPLVVRVTVDEEGRIVRRRERR